MDRQRTDNLKSLAKCDALTLHTLVQTLSPTEQRTFHQLAEKMAMNATPVKKPRAPPKPKAKEDKVTPKSSIDLMSIFFKLEANVRENMAMNDSQGFVMSVPEIDLGSDGNMIAKDDDNTGTFFLFC